MLQTAISTDSTEAETIFKLNFLNSSTLTLYKHTIYLFVKRLIKLNEAVLATVQLNRLHGYHF